jgi:hypothetical protein
VLSPPWLLASGRPNREIVKRNAVMFRHIFAIGILGVVGCILWHVERCTAGESQRVDPERQLVFKVKGLT